MKYSTTERLQCVCGRGKSIKKKVTAPSVLLMLELQDVCACACVCAREREEVEMKESERGCQSLPSNENSISHPLNCKQHTHDTTFATPSVLPFSQFDFVELSILGAACKFDC